MLKVHQYVDYKVFRNKGALITDSWSLCVTNYWTVDMQDM